MSVPDCFVFCCGQPNNCPNACPLAGDFVQKVRDAGGLSPRSDLFIRQDFTAPFPAYTPCVQHEYGDLKLPDIPYVAIPTFAVFGGRPYGPSFDSGDALRQAFGIAKQTRIVLLSIADDPYLEDFWLHFDVANIPQTIAKLKVDFVTAPNFSMFLNVPRTDNVVNRNRSLLSAEALSKAGCSVVPYISALTPFDWDFWDGFFRERPGLSVCVKEFQKGDAHAERGAQWITSFRRLEDSVGRTLHLLAVAGRRHITALRQLGSYTVVDSGPFMKTVNRRALVVDRGRLRWRPFYCGREGLSDLFRWNLQRYTELVNRKRLLARPIQSAAAQPPLYAMKAEFTGSQRLLF